jgi:hypothetical protein
MKQAAWRLGTTFALVCSVAAAAEEFTFNPSEFLKKAGEFTGYFETSLDHFVLNSSSAFYALNFHDGATRDTLDRATLTFKPSGKWRFGGDTTLNVRGNVDYRHDNVGDERNLRFDELYASYKPNPRFTVDVGKTTLKWGKGYAWSPVGFVERTKDPQDPELAREGFAMLSADVIRNFSGALQTVAFTPVVIPAFEDLNGDFGGSGHVNAAAKLYFLYRDTDIDFMVLGNGSRTRRFGFDFSRNLGSNLEVHGEWARVMDARHQVTDSAGGARSEPLDGQSFLLGVRHLSERETTTIFEYYHNGFGYSPAQLRDFFALVDNGVAWYRDTGDATLLQRAASVGHGNYGQPNPGNRYLYLRVSQKEPFDILYFTPAITAITNVDDRSYSIAPELMYTGITNLELRLRLFFLHGGAQTDFGEKQNSHRIELRGRFYF